MREDIADFDNCGIGDAASGQLRKECLGAQQGNLRKTRVRKFRIEVFVDHALVAFLYRLFSERKASGHVYAVALHVLSEVHSRADRDLPVVDRADNFVGDLLYLPFLLRSLSQLDAFQLSHLLAVDEGVLPNTQIPPVALANRLRVLVPSSCHSLHLLKGYRDGVRLGPNDSTMST